MRNRTIALGLSIAVTAAVVATPNVRAGGTIDTTGATFTTGTATSTGVVTTDSSASLGAVPPINDVDVDEGVDASTLSDFEGRVYDPIASDSGIAFGGLGGPNFHAHADITLSAKQHNFGSFTVDQGVTVTVAAGTTVHVAGAARIDGRLLMLGHAVLDCGGDLTVVGHAGAVTSGVASDNTSPDNPWANLMTVPGRLSVSADAGARVHLDGHVVVYGHDAATLTDFDTQELNLESTASVTISGGAGAGIGVSTAKDMTVSMSSSSFDGASLYVGGATTLTDVTIASFYVTAPTGSLRVAGASTVGASTSTTTGLVHVESLGDITFEDGVSVTTPTFSVWAYDGKVTLGTGVQVDLRGMYAADDANSWMEPYGHGGVEIRGSLKCDGGIDVFAGGGDIVLGSAAVLTAGAEVQLHAQGAVTASGGTVNISAGDLDVRCVNGDLDLDVATVNVTGGQIVVLSNGQVKLRGSFASSHDVQILSRKDAIDVRGATISTADAGASLSGFVRLATYASTATINASNATLSTGSSDGQSGDILLQIADSGGATTTGALTVEAVTTRETAAGPVTMVRGTLRAKGKQHVDFSGSYRVGVGKLSQHVFVSGQHGKLHGKAGGVDLQIKQTSGTAATFVVTLHDGAGAVGTIVPITLQRAGFQATGKFKQPKSKKH